MALNCYQDKEAHEYEEYEECHNKNANDYFDLNDNIIDRMDNDCYMIKITGKDLLHNVKNWCFNRATDEAKIQELYDIMKNKKDDDITPRWIFTVIYDEKTDSFDKLYMIDGQHRREAIRRLCIENIGLNTKYYCIVYNINNCESDNQKKAIDLFKKINNNKPLNIPDIPDMYICDIVNIIIDDTTLNSKKSIKVKDINTKANNPYIHKKELFNLLNENVDNIKQISTNQVIDNLKIIHNKLCFMEYEKLFVETDDNKKRYNTAKNIDFWLNLKTSRYSPKVWIKYILNPRDLV
jgi:hypothetical protein